MPSACVRIRTNSSSTTTCKTNTPVTKRLLAGALRPGETEDASVADLAGDTGAGQIKIESARRPERMAS
jgi:enolase